MHPDAEPVGNLQFFLALVRLHFVAPRDHFRAALAEPRHFQNTVYRSIFSVRAELSHQLVQSHDADLCIFQRLEVQQIFKFLFVLFLRFFLQ